jgi:hypothetical protein
MNSHVADFSTGVLLLLTIRRTWLQFKSREELSSPYMNRRFGGTYHLNLQGKKSAEEETIVVGGKWYVT